MVVNPAYEGISLPQSNWPLLDTHLAAFGSNNLCLDGANAVPWLPLVASPIEDPNLIAEHIQYDIANSQVACFDGGAPDQKLVAIGRENLGSRFLLGIVSLGDAQRYGLATAALQTQRTTNDTVVFDNASGRSFAAPTDASLKAAAEILKPDDALGTWPIPYDTMRMSPAGINAYPGILVLSTDVPTSGLPKQDAINYAKLLDFVAGAGQTPGLANGDLAAGYLPMTAANGLAGLASYTKAAAAAVLAQQCVVPYVSGKAAPAPSCNLPKPPPTKSTSPSSTPSNAAASTPTSTPPVIVPPASSPSSHSSSTSTPSSTPSSGTTTPAPVAVGKTARIGSGFGGFVLPIIALLALLGLAVSALMSQAGRGRRG
jgi:hypothetical protein